jgi:hypothetical protein
MRCKAQRASILKVIVFLDVTLYWKKKKKGVKISETIYYLHLQDNKVTTELVFYEILILIHNNIYYVMP